MAVYYKFKSAKEYSTVPVEGPFLSVLQLKEKIVEKMRLGRAPDFDLLISNAQTSEEYADEGFLIPKNTSVLIRRVPGTFRIPVITTEPKQEPKAVEEKIEAPATKVTADWPDEFGVDLYEDLQPSNIQQTMSQQPCISASEAAAKAEEEARIKAFCDSSASDWQRQTQQAYVGGRGRGGGGRGMGRGPGFMRKTPPDGYVCHRCNEPGHYIQHCPTNKDPAYNIKRVKPPTGIPRTMLESNPDGSYALPNGEIAVLRPNEELFEKEVVSLTSNKVVNDVPQELRCPLCKDVLKDAVLTSKCCFKSFCDRCIRDEIISKGKCVCGASNVLADDLLPNKTLRDAIDRLLESNAATSSADNTGSKYNIPDTESVLPVAKAASPAAAKAPSPAMSASALSASANEQTQTLPEPQKPVTELKDPIDPSLKPPETVAQGDEVEVESVGLNEAPDVNATEEGNLSQQAKKNKAKRMRPPKQMMPGGQMPWRPDGMEDHMMGYGPFGGPFWPPHPMADPLLMPAYGAPFNGFGGPFDVPFNGPPLLPDPYAYTGMVPPPYPQRDFGYNNYPPNAGVMSREEFEAKKAEARRKHEHHRSSRDQSDGDSFSREKRKRRDDERDDRRRDDDRDDRRRDDGRDERRRDDDRDERRRDDGRDERRRDHRDDRRSDNYDHRDRNSDRRDRDRRSRSTRERSSHHGGSEGGGGAHSSGDDGSSDRKARQQNHHQQQHKSSSQDRERDSHRSRSGTTSRRSSSPPPSREESKRRREEAVEDGRNSSSKRVSVFLRVKQDEHERKRSRSRDENYASFNHVETMEKDNEPVMKSVFTRLSHKA